MVWALDQARQRRIPLDNPQVPILDQAAYYAGFGAGRNHAVVSQKTVSDEPEEKPKRWEYYCGKGDIASLNLSPSEREAGLWEQDCQSQHYYHVLSREEVQMSACLSGMWQEINGWLVREVE